MNYTASEQEELLLLLKTLSNQLGPKFERTTNFSLSRYELLYQLVQFEEISQSNLRKRVNINQAAITRHLKQLETDGLVSRRRNPEDHRETIVQLTKEGHRQILDCQHDKRNFANEMFQHFDYEELQRLKDMLKRITENIVNF